MQTKQTTLLGDYIVKEWSDDRRGTSIQQFQERHIDMPWKIDSSKQDHNGGIYVMRHMEEYGRIQRCSNPLGRWIEED